MEPAEPCPFFREETARLREASRGAPVLDLACGRGRHALAVARWDRSVLALDRDADALRGLRDRARAEGLRVQPLRLDLESGFGIPLQPESCSVILVFRFLFRPLCAAITACLRPGGLLAYETFTRHQLAAGHGPRNPAFLLEPGELPRLFPGLEPLRHEEGWFDGVRPRAMARLLARRPGGGPARHEGEA